MKASVSQRKVYNRVATDPWGRANSFWFEDGIIVPVDEADEAEEESSSSEGPAASK